MSGPSPAAWALTGVVGVRVAGGCNRLLAGGSRRELAGGLTEPGGATGSSEPNAEVAVAVPKARSRHKMPRMALPDEKAQLKSDFEKFSSCPL